MEVRLDNDANRKLFKEIREEVGLDDRQMDTEIHLSDLTRCLTKGYFRRVHATEGSIPSSDMLLEDKSIIFMYIGMLSEDTMKRLRPSIASYQLDGVTGRADWQVDGELTELKATRMNVVRNKGLKEYKLPKNGIPLEWRLRMAGYAVLYSQTHWKLSLLLIIPGDLITYHFEWEETELHEFWNTFIKPRAEILQLALDVEMPPMPYRFNREDECNNCEFRVECLGWQDSDHVVDGIYNEEYMKPTIPI